VPGQPDVLDVAALDRLDPGSAAAVLLPCCAAARWAGALAAGRPYGSLAALTVASDAAIAALDWADIEQALAAHPRIGQPPRGEGRESAWSAREQSAAAAAGDADRALLASGNAEYEQRFGHVFLICATGKPAAQVLAALRERLGNDPAAEREVVRRELAAIAALRLAKAFR
jgi:2-oxo-4-hydroxy-4-carboxy-5-ureidoimidazoline decarboxylase